jgi:hypothetical protein
MARIFKKLFARKPAIQPQPEAPAVTETPEPRDTYQRQFDDLENEATRLARESMTEENWRNDGRHS